MISEKLLYEWVGRKIREARNEANLTQERLALLIDLERTSITNIEAGKQRIPIHILYGIADAVAKDVNQLLPPPAEVVYRNHDQVRVRVGSTEENVPASLADTLRDLGVELVP